MSDYKICKNRIHIFPFPEGCPNSEHEDCDQNFTDSLGEQSKLLEFGKTFPHCKFCFPGE